MITWKNGPPYRIIEHADKMVKTTAQRKRKIQSKRPWGHHKKCLKTWSRSHNFVTFLYWIMVKQGRKFGSIFIILRQTHVFSILLRSFRNKYHEISQINISISPYTSVLGIYLLLNTSDLFLKHIRILTTAICNHTETSFAVLITIIYKEVGFSTQLITETNCRSSHLLVYN